MLRLTTTEWVKNGCLLRSIFFLLGIEDDLNDQNKILSGADAYVDSSCFIKDHYGFARYLSRVLGRKIKYSPLRATGYSIACFEYGELTHFVVIDRDDHIIFDTMRGRSVCVAKGRITGYRNYIIE